MKNISGDVRRPRGRPREFATRIALRLGEGVAERIAAVAPDETREQFIRDAIERELKRRERSRVRD